MWITEPSNHFRRHSELLSAICHIGTSLLVLLFMFVFIFLHLQFKHAWCCAHHKFIYFTFWLSRLCWFIFVNIFTVELVKCLYITVLIHDMMIRDSHQPAKLLVITWRCWQSSLTRYILNRAWHFYSFFPTKLHPSDHDNFSPVQLYLSLHCFVHVSFPCIVYITPYT